ncbi:hypothetical protein SXCC_02747 [Gluconacetobacter sp. SXCC-1]|nr:hypothetical protein SXCC_02747 [Gluconacetobacter sp. SXCC-1]
MHARAGASRPRAERRAPPHAMNRKDWKVVRPGMVSRLAE